MTEINLIRKCIKKCGANSQLLKLVEECAELAKEVVQYVNTQNFGFIPINRDAIIEEYVDVLITMKYAKEILHITNEEIESIKTEKYKRLIEFLNTGENCKYRNRRRINDER